MILNRFAVERLLYRLSQSPCTDLFVLKGAVLIGVWLDISYRPTRDVDFSGRSLNSPESIGTIVKELCEIDVQPDGLVFDPASIIVEEIREDQEYHGFRVRVLANLGKALVGVQMDVGLGDVITPAIENIEFPTMLDFPRARLKACPRETVVAEKFQAMAVLGYAKSRMKDFYDILLLSSAFAFEGRALSKAIRETFARRQAAIPGAGDCPAALSDEFAENPDKETQWTAFIKRIKQPETIPLSEVVTGLRAFLVPHTRAVAMGLDFNKSWFPGGPWSENDTA